jgi:alpha-D-glucose phosphate-specific phosphoglucomutase
MIKFGTDGWRGIISEDYTFNNVRLVSEAVAKYVIDRGEKDKGVAVGYDARFLSPQYAENCAAVLQKNGVKVWLSDSMLPTPALTWQVKDREAALGIMITASHNPPEYNGLKLKASYGGPASPELVAEIEQYVRKLENEQREFPPIAVEALPAYAPQSEYLSHVKNLLDKKIIVSFKGKLVFDVMHGSAMGYPSQLAKEYGLDLIEIRNEHNPLFKGVNPEPIDKNLEALRQVIKENKAVAGLATDGDGDRIGAMDEQGRYINAHQIMAILAKYLIEKRNWSGSIVQTLSSSGLVRHLAAKHGRKLYEMPVGFKHVTSLMLTEDILIGGEEAGGIGIKNYIPERDGVMLGFLLIEVMAAYGKTLGMLLDELTAEFGAYYYGRNDLYLAEKQKERLMDGLYNNPPSNIGGLNVLSYKKGDGCKFNVEGGWVIFRVSGTEPIVRIYAEADSDENLQLILQKAVHYAQE